MVNSTAFNRKCQLAQECKLREVKGKKIGKGETKLLFFTI